MSRGLFAQAVAATLEHEGGYVNDPVDPGGETKFGISKRAYPGENIAALTRERAEAIYLRDYWRPLQCDSFVAPVAFKLFDLAVNIGKRRAVYLLQDAICDLGRVVAVDGVVGPQTILGALACDSSRLVGLMCAKQHAHYENLIRRNPSLQRFAAGWARRASYAPQAGACGGVA